eukprot:TRINITY_DN4979_c0_g1_i4.p1 TRINITY_DN4979_c0_g1~~TRINITY_DN4979_c0_g1_i4.p1  ORF type:complete len:212 (-),score=48.48 TRINITY_DN4979_c0_g1_i4:1150-1785(-)
MFIRLGIEDTIKIRCYQLESGKFSEHLEDELHAKYSNKVIPGQGLVIAVRDYEHIGSPFIYPGQGNVHIKVKFGVIVFRPFVDEIMQGSIRFSDPTGMLISTGFFEDVFIPKDELPKPAHFNELEGLWVWKYDENDLYFEQNEMVRFRVTSVRYLDRVNFHQFPKIYYFFGLTNFFCVLFVRMARMRRRTTMTVPQPPLRRLQKINNPWKR